MTVAAILQALLAVLLGEVVLVLTIMGWTRRSKRGRA
jgi:hypothetical protein